MMANLTTRMELQLNRRWCQFSIWIICFFIGSEARVCLRRKVAEPKCVTNAQNFVDLVNRSDIFVDKSLFVKSFVTHHQQVLALHLPRGWGKTTNLDMLEAFLKIETDSDGKSVHPKETSAFQVFSHKGPDSEESSNLEISQHHDVIENFLGQHPVIKVAFRPFSGALTVDNFYHSLKIALSEAFMQHRYMLRVFTQVRDGLRTETFSKMIADHNYNLFLRHLTKATTDAETNRGIDFLNGILRNHFGRPAYVFVDDYDQFFRNISTNKIDEVEVRRVLGVFKEFLKTSFKHVVMKKALIVGILSIGTSSILEDGTENTVYNTNLLDDIFPNPREHIGFSESDIATLFKESQINKKLAEDAKHWYDGYSFPRFSSSTKVFNPLDIVNFLKTKAIRNYWLESESSYLKIFEAMLKNDIMEINLVSLLTGNPIVVVGSLSLRDDDMFELNKFITNNDTNSLELTNVGSLFSRLCCLGVSTGYLTLTVAGSHHEFWLPKQDMNTEITKIIKKHYFKRYNIDEGTWIKAEKEFECLRNSDDAEVFVSAAEALFHGIPHYASTTKFSNDDRIMNRLMLNVLSILAKTTYESLRRSGELTLIPSTEDYCLVLKIRNLGMIIGLRYNESPEETLRNADYLIDLFEIMKTVEKIKIIGINLSTDKTVQLKMKNCAFKKSADGNKSECWNF